MKKLQWVFLALIVSLYMSAQVKVSGFVYDEYDFPVPFANIYFEGTNQYTSSNSDGSFYLESDVFYPVLVVEQEGLQASKINLSQGANYDMKIILKEKKENELQGLVISTPVKYKNKKENPAYKILRNVWANRKTNGLKKFTHYQYEEYEKIEFDANNIDSTFMSKKLFKGMEFIFNNIDTSNITGKSYLPLFLNESLYKVYGRNKPTYKLRKDLVANKTSGFDDNEIVAQSVKNLYKEYDIYENRINFFNKAFVSPIARDGFGFYEYQLLDTLDIDNGRCFLIKYFPKREGEYTFKGSFCIVDTLWSVHEIKMQSTKEINVNFIRDIYAELQYKTINDSVYVPEKTYTLFDLSLIDKKDKSKGMFAHRTVSYKDYDFEKPLEEKFYDTRYDPYATDAYQKEDEYWAEARHEKLSEDEVGIYLMLDSLNNTPKFKRLINTVEIIASGYYNVWNSIDIGNLYSTFGYNEIEGLRIRAGARTYFSRNDTWRIGGFLAYGLQDDKFKYGVEGRFMLDKFNRFIVGLGTKRDIEQLGVQLTTDDGILTRTFASSALLARGDNSTLSNINKTNVFTSLEPWKNFVIRLDGTFQNITSAGPDFSINYIDNTGVESAEVQDTHYTLSLISKPLAKYSTYGIDRYEHSTLSPTVVARYTHGVEGVFDSDFIYDKIQVLYSHPILWGTSGLSNITLEAGKTFGKVPLSLLSVVPANQSASIVPNTFSQLNYYEFITDTYVSMHWEHHFNGLILNRIPLFKKLKLREVAFIRGVWGELDQDNIDINRSSINYLAPSDEIYYEYGFGIENIGIGNWRIFRVDFNWRGNYLNNPNISKFGVKFGFQLVF